MATVGISLPVSASVIPDDTSGSAAAQLQIKQSSGTDPQPTWVEALFDASTDEHVMWTFIMPNNYAGTPVVKVYYKATSGTTGTAEFSAAIMAITDGDSTDADGDAHGTLNAGTATVPATAGHVDVISITMTNADSVAAGDWVQLVLFRDVSGDTVAADLEVPVIEFQYSTT